MLKSAAPEWLTYPGSRATLVLRTDQPRSEIDVLCNAQGLGSLVGALLWVASFSDYGSLSISALLFVRVEGALALSVVDVMEKQAFQGHVVRLDKDRQFEWRIHRDDLKRVAINLFRVATSPEYVNWLTVNVSADSDVGLRFEVTDAA